MRLEWSEDALADLDNIVSQNLTHDVARFRYAPDRVGQCVGEPPLLWAQAV